MSDKERLEEIETKYSTLTLSSEKNITEYTEVDVEDLVFLIQNSFKQAERVQDLENHLKLYEFWYKIAYEQNKRYRKALEEIRDRGTYELNNAMKTDYAWIADKALEG